MYHKLNQKNKRYNDDDEEDDENDDESSDFDVSEISDSDHQCYETELIDRKQCGANNKPCENDIYGMPRKSFDTLLKLAKNDSISFQSILFAKADAEELQRNARKSLVLQQDN